MKLLGNVAFNPISALTGGTLEELARHPEVSKVVREIMTETEAVAAKAGHRDADLDRPAHGRARKKSARTRRRCCRISRPAGRMELEAVVGAVVELGDRLGVPMPATRAVYACAKMLDEQAQRRTRVNVNNRWFQLVRR